MYWTTRGQDLIQCWDFAAKTLTTVGVGQIPRSIPSGTYTYNSDPSMATLQLLADGGVLVHASEVDQPVDTTSGDRTVVAFKFSPGLTSYIGVWEDANQQNRNGYSGYQYSMGTAHNGVNWKGWAVPGDYSDGHYGWMATGWDNNGNLIDQMGNADLIPSYGNAYVGEDYHGTAMYFDAAGDWLYRSIPNDFCVVRVSRNDIQGVFYPKLNPDRGDISDYVGFCAELGLIVTVTNGNHPLGNGYVQLWDPANQPWQSAIPNGLDRFKQLSNCVATYNSSVTSSSSLYDNPGGACIISGKFIIYTAFSNNSSYDANGYGIGSNFSFYAMDLSTGAVTKILDVPYHYYDINGNIVSSNDPAYYDDNYSPQAIMFDNGGKPDVLPVGAAGWHLGVSL